MKYKLLRFSLLSILSMLCGTLVAADKWVKTDPASLTTGDVVVIVDQTSASAMSNDQGTSKAPTATGVTLNDDKSEISGDVAANLQWVVTVTNGSYQFNVAGTDKYLYCINSNNGVRVGTNTDNNAFTITQGGDDNADFLMNTATSRYLGVYQNQDWRCYGTINNNIKATVTTFYKKAGGQEDTRTATSVTVGEDQAGLVNTTMNLPIAVVTDASGLTVEGAAVVWTSSNEEVAKIDGTTLQLLAPGTATITATYEGSETYKPALASFKVTVSKQYNDIAAMLQDITGTKTNVTYTFENLLVRYVNGSNTYVTDGKDNMLFYGRELGLVAGDIISGSVKGQLYTFNALPELSLTASDIAVQVVSSNNEVVPSVIELNALQNNINNYVTIKNAVYVSADGKNLTFKMGEETLAVYNQFNLDVTALVADKAYDITGFGSIYNETIQIYPTEIKEAQAEEPADGFRDFAVNLTNSDIFATDVTNFGVKVNADGTYSAIAADDATANFTVKAVRFNDAQHGWVNCVFTIPVQGPVLIKLGDCQFGDQTGTITDTEGNVTELTKPAKQCWAAGNPDQNVVATYYRGLTATTLTVQYNGYCPFISVTAVDPADLPAEVAKHTVTFAAGEATGEAPAAIEEEEGAKITLPTNFTLYVEGKTLTAWSDGTSEYAPGAEYTIGNADATLTAVFTQNEVSLSDRTEPVTVKWNFRRDQGAPAVGWEGAAGLVWVAQATIGDKTIDVALPFSTAPGKFNNKNNTDWVQINNGTTFTVPSCKGATISMEAYNDITTTTIDGQTDYTQGKTISYEIAGSAESVDVVIGDGSYYRYIQVVLPVVQSQAGGEKFDNVAGTIHWPVGNEQTPTISDGIAGGISSASVSTGSELTITTAKYFDTDMVHYTPKTGNAGNVEGVMIEYRVKPAKGITFKPTQIEYAAVKVGTDGATYSWSYTVDGVESSITQIDAKKDLLRNNGSNSVENGGTAKLMHTETFNVDACNEFTLRFYISACANNKNICIGNLTISGIVNGEAVSVNMYKLATAVASEEGGSINVYPVSEEYEEGSEVTLTATENFGYDFVNWTDANGNVVSEEAKFKYTINADETLTANFKQVETYELALTVDGANDYMVKISPTPTMVDDKMMYEAGTTVELTADQYDNLVTFTNWSDGETSSSKVVKIDADVTLTAVYAQADIIAGWDFYTSGNSGRKADYASADNDAAALSLVNTESGETKGWLDKSTIAGGGYESFKGAAVNWNQGSKEGEVGLYHWQTKVNAEAFTDITVQFQMLYNYNAYQTYNAEYSLDGENWTKFGSVTMNGAKNVASFSEKLPEACNNQKELYIRMLADKTSTVDGTSSKNDGNTLAMFFITGTPKLVDDGVAPVLVSTVPANGATGVSATGKIVLTFDERIQIADGATATLGSQTLTPSVNGKTATFAYKGLEYSTEYTFTLPANTVSDLTGNTLAEAVTLTFTTMVRPTVTKGLYDAVVENVDQLMAAISAAESRSDKNVRFRIFIKNGEYTIPLSSAMKTANGYEVPECITFLKASNVSFIGESRDGVIITNGIDKTETFVGKYGTTSKYDGIGNSDVFQIQSSVSGLYWQDLTVETGMDDATGRDLAIHDRGTQNIYKNVGLRGYQDTWTSNNDRGLYYFEDGYVRGRTDYMCGKGDIFWNRVELRQIAGGYAAVPSKPANIGWVYKDCVINGEPAVVNFATQEKRTAADVDGNYTLGRPWGSGTPVALFIDTKMNVVPSAIGWNEMSGGWPARFAEYNSTTSTGSIIDLSGRKKLFGETKDEQGNITQEAKPNDPVLTAAEALEYSDMSKMYGDWNPTLATEQAPVPQNVELTGTKLTWDDSNYALLWAVCKNGAVVGFTTEPTFDVDDTAATYTVRAANEMGGLSEASAAASVATGIKTVSGVAAVAADGNVYNMQGVRVASPRKGLYIVGGRKVVVK